MTTNLVCKHCGWSGADVHHQQRYVGGHGYQQVVRCRNQVACWRRWDAKYNQEGKA